MFDRNLRECLTFDDVMLVPAYSEVLPNEVDVRTRLTKKIELNATDLLHAAYGLQGDRIVLSAALEADNLDLNELEATLADMGMALSKHVPFLREMAEK